MLMRPKRDDDEDWHKVVVLEVPMSALDPKVCVICGASADGTAGFDHWTDAMRVPACQACGDSETFLRWFEQSLQFLRDCPISCESQGNLALDLAEAKRSLLSAARMDDGICPNGCARMIRYEPHDNFTRTCPVCGFVGWQNTPIDFPYGDEDQKPETSNQKP